MPWNLLILPLIGGYFILSRCNLFKYKQQRLDKQRLVFDSILAGIIVFILTMLIRYLVDVCFPELIPFIYNLFPFHMPFIGTALSSFVISIIFTFSINISTDEKSQLAKSIEKTGDELELMLLSSFTEANLLQFTLDTSKVYIGWVIELPIPLNTNYIRIIPAFSGFRTDRRKLEITTHYLNVYDEIIKSSEEEINLNPDLIIKLDRIVSVSYFDTDLYERFNNLSESSG